MQAFRGEAAFETAALSGAVLNDWSRSFSGDMRVSATLQTPALIMAPDVSCL
ncbi:MAG: hypothetical protein L7S53_08690 [Luminiphilus sp.]|nr:hypothetical protein [Luminiphilus sp.]